MKVLHLFSESRWLYPAEQVVNLCRGLQDRGINVALACTDELSGNQSPVTALARETGLHTVNLFRPGRRLGAGNNMRDAWILRQYIHFQKVDLVHAHTGRDHLLAGLAARHCRYHPAVVRTSYGADGLTPSSGNRILAARYTDGLITCSRAARARSVACLALPAERVRTIHGAVDTDRFSPRAELPDIRLRLRLSGSHFVLGISPSPHGDGTCEALLDALGRASKQVDELRVMLIGHRSTTELAVLRPAKTLHMANCAVLPTGLDGDAYVAAVNALDAKLFLRPDHGRGCAALLEAMSLGKPCIVPARGALPEIVSQGTSGLVVRQDPVAISGAIVRLASSPRLCKNLGTKAREVVVQRFSLERQASIVEDVYSFLLTLGPRKAGLWRSQRARSSTG
jgi:glycosyltransferase involved in cell wall biosynthesis